MTFSEKLYQLRRQKGMSQEELADRLEVSRQAVSRWEMGSTLPDAKNLLQLSDIFGVSIDYLLRDGMETDRREETAFRQFDTPAPKTDFFHSERNRRIGLSILVALQMLPLFLYFVGIFVMTNTMTLLLASLMSLLNIAVVEITFHICGDERGRYYRRKYYRITVWMFTWCPVSLAVQLLSSGKSWVVQAADMLIGRRLWPMPITFGIWLVICFAVTFLLRERKKKE